jgi:hypothetical protein
VIALERGRIFRIKDDEADTVKACQTVFRTEPKIAIVRLRDCVNGVVRQSRGGSPSVLSVLRNPFRRIESCPGIADTQKGEGKQKQATR